MNTDGSELSTSKPTSSERLNELEIQYGGPAIVTERGPKGALKVALNQPLLAALFAEERLIIYDPELGCFFQYFEKEGIWKSVTEDSLLADIDQLLLRVTQGSMLPLLKATGLRTRRLFVDLIGLLRGLVEEHSVFETRMPQIVAANGVLRLDEKNLVFTKHHPTYYARYASPFAFDQSASCPEFLKFLNQCFPESVDRRLVQAVAAQWLLGKNITQTIIVFHGLGRSGKSTLVSILRGLVGENNCSELRTEHLTSRFEIFNYLNKSLLIGSDVPGDFLCTAGAHNLKKLTGDDLVSIERKSVQGFVEMNAALNIGITSNSALRLNIQNDTEAWRGRLVILKFTVPPPANPVRDLAERLIAEEGSGILNWALGGIITLIDNGWRLPLAEKHHRAVSNLLDASDSLTSFLENGVEPSYHSDLTMDELCSGYRMYCKDRGWKPLPNAEHQMKANAETALGIAQSHDIKRGSTVCRGFRNLQIKKGVCHG